MENVVLLGLFAGVLTTTAFLPQVIRIWRLKEARDISLITFLILSLGVLLWLAYGILIKDIPIILSNSVTLILALIILLFKIKYE